MAIARMSHLRLIAKRGDKNRILDTLIEGGLFEARKTDCVSVKSETASGRINDLKLKQSKISFALDFLRARHGFMAATLKANAKAVKSGKAQAIDYTLSAENYSSARKLITKADFSDAAAREYELMHVCDELKKLSFKLVEATSRGAALDQLRADYLPFTAIPIKFSMLTRDGDVTILLYSGRISADLSTALDKANCAYQAVNSGGIVAVIALTRKQNEKDVAAILSAAGLSRCTLADDCTAEQKLASIAAERADLEREIFEITKTALGYEKYVSELKILFDVIELDLEKAEAEQKFANTDSTFVLEGWLPEDVAQATADKLTEAFPDIFLQLLAPEEKDAPPTLVVSNKVVAPYESITNMYSPPRYREIDPNPIMAIFFFLFFGIMIGDAAYGVILAAVGLALGCTKKFDKGMRGLLLLIGMGGISAIIWGIMFGGYFAIDFGKDISVWFNPLSDPMTMLVLSVVLGAIQLFVGYVIKFIRLCMDGKPFSAIFDAGSIMLLFGALACLGINMVLTESIPGLTTAAIVLGIAGVALIIIFGGRHSKNPVGKVVGGFKGLYGLVNLFSDILSYCRLFGLGLASGAIGLAFNTLGNILFQIPVIGYPVGIIILIPLHVFNLALGILGAYVHNARLQFLEFYGKFYDGGGRLFVPLGSRTKYIRYS